VAITCDDSTNAFCSSWSGSYSERDAPQSPPTRGNTTSPIARINCSRKDDDLEVVGERRKEEAEGWKLSFEVGNAWTMSWHSPFTRQSQLSQQLHSISTHIETKKTYTVNRSSHDLAQSSLVPTAFYAEFAAIRLLMKAAAKAG
jgi:hypothetical protein